jgi:hypothetical protein
MELQAVDVDRAVRNGERLPLVAIKIRNTGKTPGGRR